MSLYAAVVLTRSIGEMLTRSVLKRTLKRIEVARI